MKMHLKKKDQLLYQWYITAHNTVLCQVNSSFFFIISVINTHTLSPLVVYQCFFFFHHFLSHQLLACFLPCKMLTVTLRVKRSGRCSVLLWVTGQGEGFGGDAFVLRSIFRNTLLPHHNYFQRPQRRLVGFSRVFLQLIVLKCCHSAPVVCYCGL